MSSRFYVGKLPPEVTETSLSAYFVARGLRVENVEIVLNRSTGLSRGFGFVQIEGVGTAPAAIASLGACTIEGRDVELQIIEERALRA